MKIYRNKYFTRRDYEATNLLYQETEKFPINPNTGQEDRDTWVETSLSREDIQDNEISQLWIQSGRKFYGYL